ncbi:MAG TPA: GHMP kinase [Candidatus Polarisedimenticolia bacterium]|nr:GHMP kinase [Candidatus Polarisedimenticolia bacterium]
MSRRVEARAPTRIDLAGGTVDLWPLSLLTRDPLTVNAAIDLHATATVERATGAGLAIASRDRGVSGHVPAGADLHAALAAVPKDLEFIARLAHHFLGREADGVRIVTDCAAPAGSGLGGSSTLGIALAAALDRFTARGLDPERLLGLVRGIETQVLAIPTGEQDYHPAQRGGVLALRYTVEGTVVEPLSADLEALKRRTVLVFTGISRNSGLSNWDICKRYLDGDRSVREALQATSDAAHAVRKAILASDYDAVGPALAEEWRARLRLSPAVTDARIDALIASGIEAGARAGKVCGAGGGGCLVLWTPDDRREAVRERLRQAGGTILDFSYVSEGVRLTVS